MAFLATTAKIPCVLIVDDSPAIRSMIRALLQGDYTTLEAGNGQQAIDFALGKRKPDLILLDVVMPDMDGYATLERLQASALTADIPVIFLTAKHSEEDEKRGLALGAVDYIAKPICPSLLLARVHNHIMLKGARDFLQNQNSYLESEVQRRTAELTEVQKATIMAMASLAETRDSDTGNHLHRTQYYVLTLAQRLRSHPRFAASLDDRSIDAIYRSAPLHDIGKVGIPDHILLKPGRLTPEEFEVMKTHTVLGRDVIAAAERLITAGDTFLTTARHIAYSHHEKWDGSGYPLGLRGEEIPLPARLMALADVYDALICRRVYKAPMSHEKAVAIITEGRGLHFDPDVVDAFLTAQHEFCEIAIRFSDSEEALQHKENYLKIAAVHGAPQAA